jgi:hypothetical protein
MRQIANLVTSAFGQVAGVPGLFGEIAGQR